jgi:hypothetical protein
MIEPAKYKCSVCGNEHEEWPALVYTSPSNYDLLSKTDKEKIGYLDTDFCVITHPDQTDRYIRCTMTQKVNDSCEDLEYGLWVSLSEKSYEDYHDNFNNSNHETMYFGWLSNDLPDYDFSEASIPTTVFTRTGNDRPYIVPHSDFEHPFVNDYYNGISMAEAERRIQAMLNIISGRTGNLNRKSPWWRFW